MNGIRPAKVMLSFIMLCTELPGTAAQEMSRCQTSPTFEQRLLSSLWQPPNATRHRVTSWNQAGDGSDSVDVPSGESFSVADVKGSGRITRLWFTVGNRETDTLGKVTLRFTFDGETSVRDVPMGMFFATGPWRVNDITGPVVSVMRSKEMIGPVASRIVADDDALPGRGSFNMTFEMPFGRGFQIEATNGTPEVLRAYWYVDYEMFPHPTPPLLFHAVHRKSSPTSVSKALVNTDPSSNYVIADIVGYEGKYVGTVLAVESAPKGIGRWYEGDDMFVIDGEPWPPRLHGTGTEDYFGMAWGIHRPYQSYDHGISHFQKDVSANDRYFDGRFVLYRWHLNDPIQFQSSLHASIESGDRNQVSQHYESMAFWYGRKLD